MEAYCGDLNQFIRRQNRPLTPPETTTVMACMVEGLSFLRSKRIIHREIKPEIMLIDDKTGYIRIGDLGLSVQTEKSSGMARYLLYIIAYLNKYIFMKRSRKNKKNKKIEPK